MMVRNDYMLWLLDRREEAKQLNPFIEWLIVHEERAQWQAHRDDILPAWIRACPGTRPSCWWRYDAPLLKDAVARYGNWPTVRGLREPRRQIDGGGKPSGMSTYKEIDTWLGVPKYWCGTDSADPPRYESQHAYLSRHHLLMPGERTTKPEPVFELVHLT
jgi:hypothetical protein